MKTLLVVIIMLCLSVVLPADGFMSAGWGLSPERVEQRLNIQLKLCEDLGEGLVDYEAKRPYTLEGHKGTLYCRFVNDKYTFSTVLFEEDLFDILYGIYYRKYGPPLGLGIADYPMWIVGEFTTITLMNFKSEGALIMYAEEKEFITQYRGD